MQVTSNLNGHVPWDQVVSLLGLSFDSRALPVQLECPICRQRKLTISEDIKSGGQWHHCSGCQQSGDMIELASAAWKLPLHDTVQRLILEGIPFPDANIPREIIDEYHRTYSGFQKRLLDFWTICQQQGSNTRSRGDFPSLRKKMGLVFDISPERHMNGLLKIYGFATVPQAEDAINLRRNRVSPFAGHRTAWRDCLVIPYFAAPNQIVGFYFMSAVGHEAYFMAHHRDCGLAGLPLLSMTDTSHVIAMHDPFLLLRMQVRQASMSGRPLPLVAWHHSPSSMTRHSWMSVGSKQLVFWGPHITPEMLVQCKHMNGSVSLVGPAQLDSKTVNHFLRLSSPTDLVHRIIQRSRPWEEALRFWAKSASELQVMQFLSVLNVQDIELAEKVRQLTSSKNLPPRTDVRRARIGVYTYIERGGRWYVTKQKRMKTERLLFDGIVRIHHIVNHGRELIYHGEAKVGDQVVPFAIPNHQYFNIMLERALRNADVQVEMPVVRSSLPAHLDDIAKQFHTPVCLKGYSRIGWDGRGYIFRRCRIEKGVLHEHPEYMLPPDAPGPSLGLVKFGSTMPKRMSMSGYEAEMTWTAVITLLTQILAPEKGWEPLPLLWTGLPIADGSHAILRRLGFPERELPRLLRRHARVTPQSTHKWPVIFTARTQPNRLIQQRLMNADSLYYCAFVPELIAYSVHLLGGCYLIHSPHTLSETVAKSLPLEHVIQAFLRYHTKHKQGDVTGDPWLWVQRRLQRWLESEGGDSTAIENARKWILLPSELRKSFKQTAIALYRLGFYEPPDEPRWTVTVNDLKYVFKKCALIPPTWSALPISEVQLTHADLELPVKHHPSSYSEED